MNKYEKFMTNTNDKLNSLVHEIEASGSSDAFIIAYVNDNKDIIRKIAASNRLDERQTNIYYMIRYEVQKAGICDYDDETIYKALRGIGVHSEDKTMVMVFFFWYIMLNIVNNIFYFLGNGSQAETLAYKVLYPMNIIFALMFVFVSYIFISGSKFRLFMVKK